MTCRLTSLVAMKTSVSDAHIHTAGYNRRIRPLRNEIAVADAAELMMTKPDMTKNNSTPTHPGWAISSISGILYGLR